MTTPPQPGFFSTRNLSRRERKALHAPVKAARPGRRDRKAPREETGPGAMGWDIPGGGKSLTVSPVPEFRGPTVQVCGLYPFAVGSSLALVGAPLGPHLHGRGQVCGDPVSWYLAGLIHNPSAFVLARPGVGKSTLVRHIAGFLPYKGVLPIVLSDWKPDYVDLVLELDGQVIELNRSSHFVNPLDPGPLALRLDDVPEEIRIKILADMRGRRMNVMEGLCGLALGQRLKAHERNILSAAMELWDKHHPREVPVIADILAIIEARPAELRRFAQDREDPERYAERTQDLIDALMSLNGGSEIFGRVFAEPTTVDLLLDRAVVFDLSAFEEMDPALQAAVQLVCWSYGSTAVSASKVLSDAGLAPRRSYLLVMDELWRALRAAEFMVDRVDEITRLNRTLGLGQMLISHGMDDLKVHSEEATAKAWGFVGRSEIVYLGGLVPGEMGNLEEVFALSGKDKDMLTSWAAAGEPNPVTGEVGAPVGRGKFILKVGKKAGIPFTLDLTPVEIEKDVHNTDRAWSDTAAAMRGTGEDA
ncbi:ATP/GTP-binding protein [Nocardioides pacificus]